MSNVIPLNDPSMCFHEPICASSVEHKLRFENKRLRDTLKSISNVLGTGKCTQPNCEGCHYEMEEAATYARGALTET